MANSVTREVILKVKLAGDKASVGAAIKDQDKLGKAAERAAKLAERAEAKAARERKRESERQEKADNRVHRNRIKLIAQVAKAEEKRAQEAIRNEERIKAASERAAHAQLLSQRAQMQGYRQMGQGALDVAQGLLSIGLLTEENTEKFARMYVRVAEGFRVIRGGMDVYRGIEAAATAAAKAQALSAAASGLVAAGGGGAAARGAGTAGAAAAGAAGGAAAAGGGTVLAFLKAKAAAAATGLAKLSGLVVVAGAAYEVSARTVNALGGKLGTLGQLTDEINGLMRDRAAAEAADNRTKQMEAARAARIAAAADRDQRITSIAGIQSQARAEQQSLQGRIMAASGDGGIDEARTERARAAGQLERAEAEVEAERQRALDRQRRQEFASMADQIQAVDQLREARERVAAADERIVASLRQQTEQRKQSVLAAEQELSRVQDTVKAEEARQQSALARFGQLDRASQSRLQDIAAQQQAGGALTRSQADFLNQTGFGQSQAEQFFAQQGRAAGGEGVLGAFGENDALNQARADEVAARERLAAQNEQLRLSQEAQTAATLEMSKSLQTLADAINAQLQLQATAAGGSDEQVQSVGFSVAGALTAIGRDATEAAQRNRQQQARILAAQVNQP